MEEQSKSVMKVSKKLLCQFMGLDSEDEDAAVGDEVDAGLSGARFSRSEQRRLWHNRRVRLAGRLHGGVKNEFLVDSSEVADVVDHPAAAATTEGFEPVVLIPVGAKPTVAAYAKRGLLYAKKRLFKRQGVVDRNQQPLQEVHAVNSNQENKLDEGEVFFDARAPGDTVDNNGRIANDRLAGLNDNSDRNEYGVGGLLGKFLIGRVNKNRQRSVRHQLDELEDYRPHFTYWITTIQTVIMIISLAWYGFAPFGTGMALKEGLVFSESLTLDQVAFRQPTNFWGGPRPADLIHLGAKYSPCMRYDVAIGRVVAQRRRSEARNTGCCVRNDFSGCMQSTEDGCSPLLSTFYKWGYYDNISTKRGPGGEVTGPVCGLDPRYCKSPSSAPPNEWSHDISQWPVCKKTVSLGLGAPPHLTCKVTARPCCIGIHGRCELRSQQYCAFVNGHFHPEASLCSQVDCMGDVCGMLSFKTKDSPDQVYRLWTPLFLHAGLLHLAITWLVQWYLMRDLERLCGPVRMAIIYLGAGIAGNAASAVFVPHRAESGPAGSQYGLLAALLVEVLNSWPMLKHPLRATAKLTGVLVVLLLAGFLPWIDNYAHAFGFLGGVMLSLTFMPYLTFMTQQVGGSHCSTLLYTKRGRIHVMVASSAAYVLLVAALLAVFYGAPDMGCEGCKYFSCIPFTDSFCAEQNIDFEKSPVSIL